MCGIPNQNSVIISMYFAISILKPGLGGTWFISHSERSFMPDRQIYENYIIYDFVGEKFNRTETIAIAKKQNIGTNPDGRTLLPEPPAIALYNWIPQMIQ